MPYPNADRRPGVPVRAGGAAGSDSGRRFERNGWLPAVAGVPSKKGGKMRLSDEEIKNVLIPRDELVKSHVAANAMIRKLEKEVLRHKFNISRIKENIRKVNRW